MIRSITVFETSDGRNFNTRQDAEAHESKLIIGYELKDISTYGQLSIDDVVEYIVKNFVRKDNA